MVSDGTFTAASWTTPLGNTIAITGYNPETGVVTYTYTLLDNENHPAAGGENALFEDFAVTLTDLDGDAASDTLSVRIVDDVPTARNDTDTLPPSSTQESGNVITGAGTTSGNAGADTQGADGAAVSGLRAGTSGTFANAGSTVTGQFGTLTLGANGGYTYTRSGNAGSGQSDTFSYQLTDGDGDVSTATLVIAIPDRPATVNSVPTTGGGTSVNEAGLGPRGSEPPGTNEPAPVETTAGAITFSTPDGFGSLQINGTTITGTIGQPIPTSQGNLIVTGFNPAAGTLTYSYTLPDNTVGNNAINDGNTTITLSVTVTDTDGDADTKPFVITIVDDAPIARDDADSVASGTLAATGNILTGTDFGGGDANGSDGVGDTPGADGATLTGIVSVNKPLNSDSDATGGFDVAGEWGALHVDTAGNYTYTRSAETPGGVQDKFTYTLTDGDGDIRTATLTIGIDNRTPAGGSASVVLDDDDANANGIAGNAINGDLVPVGPSGPLPDPTQGDPPLTYSFPAPGAAPAGFAYDTATANTLKIFQTQGANQVLVVTVTLTNPATGAYTVVQNATIRHASGGNENNADFAIAYQVKDLDNQTANGTFNIRINDDMPVATVADRGTPALVLDESANGADTAGAVSPAGLNTITANFTSNFNTAAYGADGAGSVAYALLLNGGNVGSGLFALDTTDKLVDGDGYGQGAQILLNQSGDTITGSAGATPYFTIVINPATGVVTFTQLANIWHPSAGSSAAAYDDAATLMTALASDIKVQQTVTDADNDSATASVDIGRNVFAIQDDGPDAVNDTDSTGAPGTTATGNVITDLAAGDAGDTDTGADKTGTDGATIAGLVSVNVPASPDTDPGSGFSVAGAHGTLTMQANGDYSYTRNAGTPGGAKDTFTYTLKDGDGDTDTATLEITLGNAAPAGGRADVVLDDDDANANGIAGTAINGDLDAVPPSGPLPDPSQGDAPLTYSFPAPGAAPAGFTYDTATANTLKIFQGATLVVTVTLNDPATGAYTVVQNATILHAAGGNENSVDFAIAYQVKDADLQTATGTLNIRVNDDTPTATASANSTVVALLDETSTITTAATLGAANIGNDPDVANAPSATGYISRVVTGGAVVTPGGGYGADGAGSLSYALSVTNATSGRQVTDGSAIDLVLEGSIVVGRVQGGIFANQAAFAIGIGASTGVVTVEQYLSLKHPGNPNPDDALPLGPNTLGVTVTRTDADSDSTTSAAADISGQIQFRDDGPAANPDTDSVTGGTLTAAGNAISGVGTTNAPGSADKAGADGGARVTFIDHSDANPGASVPDGGSVNMAGQYGTLNIASNGDYTYTRNANTPGGVQDQFTYTLIDGDGDTVTTTLTITVNNAAPAAGTLNATLDDDALTSGIAGDNGDATDASPDTSNLGGTLPDPLAGDAPLTYALSAGVTAAGGAANLTYVLTGDVLEIKQGGVAAITVTLTDHTAGTYTIVQNKPLLHANAGSENNQTFAIPYSVTDQDGQVANGTINIDVDDDTPTVSAALSTGGNAALDETATTSAAANFGVANIGNDPDVALTGSIAAGNSGTSVVTVGGGYGADGAGSLSFGLSVTNPVSGLQVTDGSAIALVVESGVVVGRVQAGAFNGQAAFAIRATSGGVVEVEQYLTLKHPANPNPDETIQLGNGTLGIQVTRTDADSDSAVSPVIDISSKVRFDDDGPSATNDTVNAVAVTQPINAAFVMDFSGSVDNDELHIQLNAVKDAAYELFASTSGGVTIRTVVFASTSISYAPITTFAAFVALIDSLDPAQGGTRPISSSTDFTDAIQTLMGVYSAVPGSSNQVFFLSDGNPNEQTGTGGNSLTDARAALWNTFVDTNNVNVTAIGIGNGINATRLADVDLNDPPNNVPILVENFTDLVDALNVATLPPVAGNVMTNDSPGADGARVTLADNTLNGTAAQAVPNGGFVDVAGQFGTLRIYSDGSYTYTYSGGASAGQDELFSYVLTDGDGDIAASATLTIDIDAVTGGSNFARNDTIVTNQTSPSTIPVAVLLANDGAGTAVTTIASQTDATVSLLAGNVTFTGTGATGGAFEYNATQGALTDKANVSVNRAQSGEAALDGTEAGETLLGRDASSDTINGNGGNDYLFGLGGADSLVGGAGADTMTGGAGTDTFTFASGASAVTIGGSGNNGTIAGFDRVTDFDILTETLNIGGSPPTAATNFLAGNGTDSTLTIAGQTIKSHAVGNGVITFDDAASFASALTLTTDAHVAAAVQYLRANDIGAGNATVAFIAGARTFIYQQVGGSPSAADDLLIELQGVSIANLSTLIGSRVTPIVLDLNGDGARFQSLVAGIVFDYLGNGSPFKTAWASNEDGILAIDLNGDGKVDGAREFVFGGNGLTDLQSLAAHYDSNHDGLLDARDADFARFGVWRDANGNGVGDAGEFRSLGDMGIKSIGLTSDGKSYSAAGGDVTVHGESTFTWADGSIGAVADASFAIAAGDGATAAAMDALLANSGASDSAGITTADLPALQVALAEIEGTDFIDNLVHSLGSSGGSSGGTEADGARAGGASDEALLGTLASEVGSDHGYGGMPLDLGQIADEAHALAAA